MDRDRLPPGASPILKDYRVWAIAGLALLASMVAACGHFGEDPDSFRGDDIEYNHIAVTLLGEGRYDSTYRPPGYPLLVASVYAVCGPRPFAVYVVQAVLFSAALLLVCESVFWITADKTAALLAMAFCAGYTRFYATCVSRLLTETLALFLAAMFVRLLLSAVQIPSSRRCAALGLSLAALIYTKQVLLPFVAIAAVYLVWHHRAKAGTAAKSAAVLLLVVTLAILPWTYRNYLVTGRLLPLSTGFGTSFWFGWWPPLYSESPNRTDLAPAYPHTPPELTEAIRGMSEVERDDYLAKAGLSYIVAAPGTAAVNALHKFSELWLGNIGANTITWPDGRPPLFAVGHFAIPALAIISIPIFLFAIGGYLSLARDAKERAAPLILLLGWWTFAYVLTVGNMRYVMPVYPYILSFAAVAIITAFRRLAARGGRGGTRPQPS